MTTTYPIGSGHCCACSRVCSHVGGPWYCATHVHYRYGFYTQPTVPYVWPGTTTNTATFYTDRPYVGRHRKGDPEPGA